MVLGQWDKLTTLEAADKVGCSQGTITNARKAGQFPTAFKAGRNWAYALEEVERFAKDFKPAEFDDSEEEVE